MPIKKQISRCEQKREKKELKKDILRCSVHRSVYEEKNEVCHCHRCNSLDLVGILTLVVRYEVEYLRKQDAAVIESEYCPKKVIFFI